MKERTEVNPAQNLALALCGTNFRNQVLLVVEMIDSLGDSSRRLQKLGYSRHMMIKGTMSPFFLL